MNLTIRSAFPVLEELIYLDTAFRGLCPRPVMEAARQFLERRTQGTAGRDKDWEDIMERVRRSVADFVNARAEEIAFTTNTTDGTNIVAEALGVQSGENIVWDDLAHPSNKLVWLHQQAKNGVENRVVTSKAGAVEFSEFERLVDDQTRVVSVSYVAHSNGWRQDVKRLADLAHAHGAYLHVDAIQAIGCLQVDVKESNIDFLACGGYKWLMGPVGLAFLYVREELLDRLAPPRQGWMQLRSWESWRDYSQPPKIHLSARKFETGTLHTQGLFELEEALSFLNGIGMEQVEATVLRLSSMLWQGMADSGMNLITPPGTRSGIVACKIDHEEQVAEALRANHIAATVRQGTVRLAPHFFNTQAEIEQVLDVITGLS